MAVLLEILDSGAGEPAFNMALDEALLLTAADRGTAVLRFYGWTEPAATFGYFQRYEEVVGATLLRPLLRRPTGGGIVPHDRDWTYSLTVPPGDPWHTRRAVASYQRMHGWIVDAFARLGIPTELALQPLPEGPGQCFVGHEKDDVLWKGRKVAGAAQRRNHHGLLIQGSVQPPPGLGIGRDSWQEAMACSAPAIDFAGRQTATLDSAVRALADQLAETKYRQPEYHRKR